MNILAHVHGYPPAHNAGAEWMLHRIMRWLNDRGHDTRVITPEIDVDSFQGVKITREKLGVDYTDLYNWADVLITHLRYTGKSWNIAKKTKTPLCGLLHNTYDNVAISNRHKNWHIVYNSDDCEKRSRKYFGHHPSMVLNPPVFADEFSLPTNAEYITLINCNENKGGLILRDIARNMPDEKFMAVMGSYAKQVKHYTKNVKVVDNTPDIKDVLDKTKILLAPSKYESYGMAALEAMACGIPVIASHAFGFKASLGDKALFCDRYDTMAWIDVIELVRSEIRKYSDMALSRLDEIDIESQLLEFESFLGSIKDNKFNHNIK